MKPTKETYRLIDRWFPSLWVYPEARQRAAEHAEQWLADVLQPHIDRITENQRKQILKYEK